MLRKTDRTLHVYEERVLDWPQVSTRKMFGCPCYKAKSRLFAFFVTDGIIVTQLPEADREKLSRRHHTTPIRAGKKTALNWVKVPLADERDLTRIMPSVQRDYESVFVQVEKQIN